VKIGLQILLGYFLIVGLAAWFLLNVFVEEVKPGVRDTLEDTLVDTANLLAKEVADNVKSGTLQQSALVNGMHGKPNVAATINGVNKQTLDYRITITDDHGIVLFDSNGQDVGKDYSRWNDVYRTLHGTYGARSTRGDPNDDSTSVMHVAAPILDNAKIIGVLTVSKPISTVQPFVKRSQRKILQRGVVLLASSLLIGLAFAFWLSRGLHKLQSYALSVETGQKVALPRLGNNEIGALGRALESMRNKLEGKEYVEELMHTLAHELKSPIAAIQGSAELLREEMSKEERQSFLKNILEQNQRQKQLIDKLLSLIAVEKQQQLAVKTLIPIRKLVDQVEADCATKLASKDIKLNKNVFDFDLLGDALLLRQAIGNLLDNAIDFSPNGGLVKLDVQASGQGLNLLIIDHGTGIPDYAIDRVFERFYSLARPNGAKSTGLGLPFVREVILLHGGTISIGNHADGGTCVSLHFPIP